MAIPVTWNKCKSWFNYSHYMSQKLGTCIKLGVEKNIDGYGVTTIDSMDKLIAYFEQVGFKGEEGAFRHWIQYGIIEKITGKNGTETVEHSPTPYFDVETYYANKLKQLQDSNTKIKYTSVQQVKDAFHNNSLGDMQKNGTRYAEGQTKDGRLSAWVHYSFYGSREGINPSQYFNTEAYLLAKLNAMGANAGSKDVYSMGEMLAAFVSSQINPVAHAGQYGTDSSSKKAGEVVCWADKAKQNLLTNFRNTSNAAYGGVNIKVSDLDDGGSDRFTLAALTEDDIHKLDLTDSSVNVVDDELYFESEVTSGNDTIAVITDFAYVDGGSGKDLIAVIDEEGSLTTGKDVTLVGGDGADFLIGGTTMFAGKGNEYAKYAVAKTEADGVNPWVQKILLGSLDEKVTTGVRELVTDANVVDPLGGDADIYASHAKDVLLLENVSGEMSDTLTLHNFELGTDKILFVDHEGSINGHFAGSLDLTVQEVMQAMSLENSNGKAVLTFDWAKIAELDDRFQGFADDGKTEITFVYDKGKNAVDADAQVNAETVLDEDCVLALLGIRSATTSSTLGGVPDEDSVFSLT